MSQPSSENEKPPSPIVTDDDWKTRVKAEDARLDAESRASTLAEASQPSAADSVPEDVKDEDELDLSQLPPASFFTLLQMLSTQAIVAMGMIPTPSGQTTVQIPLAKHFIDLLSILETKCKGNLTADEERLLGGTLHELRISYLDVSKKQG